MHETKIHAKSFRFLYANYSKALEVETLEGGGVQGGGGAMKKFQNLCFERLDQQGSGNKNIGEQMPSSLIRAMQNKKKGENSEHKLVIN